MSGKIERQGKIFFLRILLSFFNGMFFAKVRRHLLQLGSVRNILTKFTKNKPIEPKKVIFGTFSGGIECNPKYIAQELARRRQDLDIVWLLSFHFWRKHRNNMPKGTRCVLLWTFRAFKEVGTAKVLVENAQKFLSNAVPPKRDGQFYINTWHGSLGIKRLSTATGKVRSKFEQAQKAVDVVITNSEFEEDVFDNSVFPNVRKVRVGHPRNDVFFLPEAEKQEIRARVRREIGLKDGIRFALYAPTFREVAFFTDAGGLRFNDWAAAFSSRFGGEWRIAVRLHPHDARGMEEGLFSLPDNILNLSSYEDVQELLVAADACITDYSSLVFDYLLGGGPGFIYAPDKAKFDAARGFCYPLEETPFPIAETEDSLCSNIRTFDDATYRVRTEEFLKARGCMEDGKASARTVDIIEKALANG